MRDLTTVLFVVYPEIGKEKIERVVQEADDDGDGIIR